jgi:transposase
MSPIFTGKETAMPRFKPADRSQGVMIPINYENQIMPGTLEYSIDYLVDNKIDTGIIEKRFKNDETGASAYKPAMLLKLVLLAYSRGILSSRKIERACNENVTFMAMTGGLAPDFTTIAGFITSLENEIRPIFRNILMVCSELDLLGGTEFALDGCKMSSNASKENSGTFEELKRKKEKLDATIKYLIKKHRTTDTLENKRGERGGKKHKERIKRLKNKAEKIMNFIEENEPKERSRGGEKQSNITDNESAKMKTSHGVIQGYNGLALADSKRQVIVEAEAYGSGQEHELLKPMMKNAKDTARELGLDEKYFEGKKVIADTGCFSEDNLKYLAGENIEAYIPDQQFRKRDPRFAARDSHRPKKKDKRFQTKEFVYDEIHDCFICPAGKNLKYERNQELKNSEGRFYRSSSADCRVCKFKKKCLKTEKTRQRSIYVIDRFFDRNHSEEMMRKIDTVEGRDIYSRRMGIIEPVFGNIRCCKGMDRFTLRTKKKVDIQWKLFCMVHNLGKIMRYGAYAV